MNDKITIKKNRKQVRRVIVVKKRELECFKKLFKLPGTKSDFQNKHNIQRQSVSRILERGQGVERIVRAMRKYYKANK